MTAINTSPAGSGDVLSRIEADVAALPEREMTLDRASELIVAIDSAIRRAKDAKAALEAFLIDWMPANDVQEIVIGEWRHCIVPKKREKCLDLRGAFYAVLEANGGDLNAACDSLSSDALKYGMAKKVLGPRYHEFFQTIYETDIEQRPVKKLAALNDKFTNR